MVGRRITLRKNLEVLKKCLLFFKVYLKIIICYREFNTYSYTRLFLVYPVTVMNFNNFSYRRAMREWWLRREMIRRRWLIELERGKIDQCLELLVRRRENVEYILVINDQVFWWIFSSIPFRIAKAYPHCSFTDKCHRTLKQGLQSISPSKHVTVDSTKFAGLCSSSIHNCGIRFRGGWKMFINAYFCSLSPNYAPKYALKTLLFHFKAQLITLEKECTYRPANCAALQCYSFP